MLISLRDITKRSEHTDRTKTNRSKYEQSPLAYEIRPVSILHQARLTSDLKMYSGLITHTKII
jgi:hypothetical protein